MTINNIQRFSRSVFRLLILSVVLTGFPELTAQQPDSISFYLHEAAANNPGLKAKYAQYQASLEKVPQAGTLPDPELQFGFFIKKMTLMEGYQLADFRLMQMAPWFGSLKAAKDEASKMALAKFEEMESDRNQLFFDVKNAWYQVYRSAKEIESTQNNLTLLRSLERMAIIRLRSAGNAASPGPASMSEGSATGQKAGNSGMGGSAMGSQADKKSGTGSSSAMSAETPMAGANQGGMINVLRVQMELGELENKLEGLKDQLVTNKTRFNSYLNRKPDADVFIVKELPKTTLPVSASLLADSIVNNPMIRMYDADRRANEARMVMANRMGYPMIGIGLNYSLIQKFPDVTSMMNGKDMLMPMVTATLPIYRKKYTSLQQEAGFLRDAAAESAKNVHNELKVSYQEALQLYHDADRRIDLYNRQASLAEKTITLLTQSFSVAGTDFEEILRLQQKLLDYQFKQIEALVDRNVAIATINSIIAHQ